MSIPTLTLTGQFKNAAGDPMSGTLTFRLNAPLVDSVGNIVSERVEIVSTLDSQGRITDTNGTTVGLVLYCTSGGDIAPSGLLYDVSVKVGTRPHVVHVALPDSLGSSVDWADIVPVPASTGVVWTVPDLTPEQGRDLIGSTLVAGAGLSKVIDDPGDTVTLIAEVTQAELDAEAALARNADNLTSGTVADARIASTIARDSEVTAAIAALSGTYVPLLDKRITSIAYNADSTVQSVAYNGGPTITYTYNADGTVHTSSDGTTTRTFAYNADGSIASVA